MNDTMTEGGTLIRVQSMMSQFAVHHLTNGVNKVTTVQIFKPVLIWVMGVGPMIEIMSRRIFNSVLIMSILWDD